MRPRHIHLEIKEDLRPVSLDRTWFTTVTSPLYLHSHKGRRTPPWNSRHRPTWCWASAWISRSRFSSKRGLEDNTAWEGRGHTTTGDTYPKKHSIKTIKQTLHLKNHDKHRVWLWKIYRTKNKGLQKGSSRDNTRKSMDSKDLDRNICSG